MIMRMMTMMVMMMTVVVVVVLRMAEEAPCFSSDALTGEPTYYPDRLI